MEEDAVLTLCQWMWRQRRVMLASEISYFRSPVTEQLKTGEVWLDDVIQYQCAVPEKINALISDQMKLYEDLHKFPRGSANTTTGQTTAKGKTSSCSSLK